MLQISSNQLQTFEGVQQKRFIDSCCANLVAEQSAAAAQTPVDLRKAVSSIVEQLKACGFSGVDETEYAVSLVFRYLHEPDRGPFPPDVAAKLRSERFSTNKKVEALEQLFIFGPQGPKAPFVARCGTVRI